ncbi:hypothetical protein E8E13_011135 [Curvularia kusanoi]|uniref:G domain-containing protein n=1 Tax=Curvularia kusanoi TaxID=90978 RepID=A0A9P4WE94_CURKU|nr:hypothetical protein E8E13_011135 [Curvularia kusanoi]
MASRKGRLVSQGSYNTAEPTRVSGMSPLSVVHASAIPRTFGGLQSSLNMKGTCILVMGLTGSGKSTFISKVTQQTVPIGHSLGSCTVEADMYPYQRPNGDLHWLIDTPGFDDTNSTNAKILRDIVSFLCGVCSTQKICISGLLYLHRITDTRTPNSSLKSLRILEKFCGDAAFRDVTILTTRWDTLQAGDDIEAAETRESKLRDGEKHFGPLCKGGAAYKRCENDTSSNVEIIEDILNQGRNVRLEVQLELEQDKQLQLVDTAVGRYLEGDLSDTRKSCQSKMAQMEALSKELGAGTDALAAELAKQRKSEKDAGLDMGYLSVTFEDMRKEWEDRISQASKATADFVSGSKKYPAEHYDISRRQVLSQGVMKEQEALYRTRERKMEGSRDRSTRDRSKKTVSPQWQDLVQAMFVGPNSIMMHEKRRSTSAPAVTRKGKHYDDNARSKRALKSHERRRGTKLSYQNSLHSTDCDSDTSSVHQLGMQEEDEDTSSSEDEELSPVGFAVSQTKHVQGILSPTVFQPNSPTYGGDTSIADCNPILKRTPDSPGHSYTRTPPSSGVVNQWMIKYNSTSNHRYQL